MPTSVEKKYDKISKIYRYFTCHLYDIGVSKKTISKVPIRYQYRYIDTGDLLRRLLADKFLHVAIVPANAYQRTKFQLSSSVSFGDMRGSQNKKWELLISPDALERTNFYTVR